jgi:glycosyltransferase involved in cell wall biosynthesis
MRVAIVHYWLLGMRGGERVMEALCRLAPYADIFTLFYDPKKVSPFLRSRRVKTSFLNSMKWCYRSLLPLAPMALEHFDLRGYDLVISSESGPAKGVILPSTTRHVCYCHTPMRYLWDLYPDYLHEWTSSRIKRTAMAPLANYLRVWDFATAARVDEFVANSDNVRRRIFKTYRRDATVVHPPVAVQNFRYEPAEDYYLIVSELVSYKRLDLAVRYFSRTGRRLRVAGDGPQARELRRSAGASIEFCGRVPDDQLQTLFARCRAFILPGEEDFGMTAVEATASGKAVIALGRGGVLESVPLEGAFFFDTPEDDAFAAAVERFEAVESSIPRAALQAFAGRFSEAEFDRKMRELLYR